MVKVEKRSARRRTRRSVVRAELGSVRMECEEDWGGVRGFRLPAGKSIKATQGVFEL